MRRNIELAARLVVVSLLAVACGGGSRTPEQSQREFRFDVRTESFADESRPALDTTMYVPVRTPAEAGRAFPLIVFVHGSGSNPDYYRVLLEAWARGGYVVAAPKLTSDPPYPPQDVSFVITRLLAMSAERTSPYAGMVDPERIALAGHSAGAFTVLGLGFNRCCVDRRVKAGVMLAGSAPVGSAYFSGIHTPLLVVHGVADPSVPFERGRQMFVDAAPPKIMLTVPPSDVPSADHARPYVGTENRPLPDTRVVIATSLDFFDRYLLDDRDAIDRMRTAVDAELGFKLDVVES